MSSAIQQRGEQGLQRGEGQQPASLMHFLEARKQHIAQVLPRHLKPDRLIKLAVMATKRQPALANCSMDSVFMSLLQAAELGLEPSGTLGGAYLIPYKGQCTLQIGYRGLVDLARRSGVLEQVEAHVVYEGDSFECEFGLAPKLRHVPDLSLAGRGERDGARLVYAVARLKGGAVHTEVMAAPEIERIRVRAMARRKPGSETPWDTDWAEMAKKTVVKRLCKYLPLSPEMVRAFELEDDAEHLGSREETLAAVAPMSRTETVKETVKARRSAKVVDVQPGESEEQALERARAEEPPPPNDAEAPAEAY
jgi:recombination protein RecT